MNIFQLKNNEFFSSGLNCTNVFATKDIVQVETFAIIFCNNGSATVEIDFTCYEIKKDTQIIITSGVCFQATKVSPDFSVSYIIFKPEVYNEITTRMEPSFTYFIKERPCINMANKNTRKISLLMSIIYEFYNDSNNCFKEQIFKSLIYSLILDIYDKTKILFKKDKLNKIGRQEELFVKFINLIYQHCPIEREVSFYAYELCISPRYLSSIVQYMTGNTAKNLIDKHSIRGIKFILKSTNKPMQDISYELKFPDQSFFARYFKKHTGMSPQVYRFN